MSKNVPQLPEASADPGSNASSTNAYPLQSATQEESTQLQLNTSIAVSPQNLQPGSVPQTPTKTPNSCYLVYLSLPDSGQVIMPVMAGSGVRMLNQTLSESPDGKVHQLPATSGLPMRTPAPAGPVVMPSACNAQSDASMLSQSQDKIRPPIAVVVPYNNVASNYQNTGPQPMRETSHQNLQSLLSEVVRSSSGSQPLVAQQHVTAEQKSTSMLTLPPSLKHLFAVPQDLNQPRGLLQQPGQQLTQPAAGQPLTRPAPGQTLMQRADGCQALPGQMVNSQQNGRLLQQGLAVDSLPREEIHPLSLPPQLIGQRVESQPLLLQQINQHRMTTQGGCLQPSADERANCAQLMGNHQQSTMKNSRFAVQPALQQQLLALQHSNPQLLGQRCVGNQQLAPQQANLPQPNDASHMLRQRPAQMPVGHPCLDVIPNLTMPQRPSSQYVVQQGVTQQFAAPCKGQQSLAVVVGNSKQLNLPVNIPSQSGSAQQMTSQLTGLQQQILKQSNSFQSNCPQFSTGLVQMLSNQYNCAQLGQRQQFLLLQQHQEQQQQMQQHLQQLQANALHNVPDNARVNSLHTERHGVPENSAGNVTNNLKSQSSNCVDDKAVLSMKSADGSAAAEVSGYGIANSRAENVPGVNNESTRGNLSNSMHADSFTTQPFDHHAYLTAERAQCFGHAGPGQSGIAASRSPMQNMRFASQPLGSVMSQFQLPATRPALQSANVLATGSQHGINVGQNFRPNSDVLPTSLYSKYVASSSTVSKDVQRSESLPAGVSGAVVSAASVNKDGSCLNANQNVESRSLTSQGACIPSTVVHLRMASPAHHNVGGTTLARPPVAQPEQMRPQLTFPPVGVPQFPRTPVPGFVLPYSQNSMQAGVRQSLDVQRPMACSSAAATNFGGNFPSVPHPILSQSPAGVAAGGQELQKNPATMPLPGTQKFYFTVAQPDPNLSSIGPPDVVSAAKELEVGQECEIRYNFNGQRLKTVWDGKYFKLKRPLYGNPEQDASRQPTTKENGDLAPKNDAELASNTSAAFGSPMPTTNEEQSKPTGDAAVPSMCSVPPCASPSVSASTSTSAVATKRPREEGKFAVCQHCGAFSCDYDRCDQCHRVLPADVKLYEPKKKAKVEPINHGPATPVMPREDTAVKKQARKSGSSGTKRSAAESRDGGANMATPNSSSKGSATPKKPPGRPTKKQEAEIVHILSSDEEEEDEDPLGSKNKTPSTSGCGSNKAKKLKGDPQSANTSGQERTATSSKCQQPNTHPAVGQQFQNPRNQSFGKGLDPPVLTADVIHAFFGFIRYERKCTMILDANMMSLQPVDANDGSPLSIGAPDIQMVAGHVSRSRCLTCIFYLVSPAKAEDLRPSINCTDPALFNPAGNEDCAKYIILFLSEQRPNFMLEAEQIVLRMHGTSAQEKPQYKHIDNFEVEKYLQKVCPNEDLQKFIQFPKKQTNCLPGESRPQRNGGNEDDEDDYGSRSPSPVHVQFSGQIIKLFTYPPPPATGGITVTNEDLFCLNEGEFLNDVIIDFYLKYLMTEFLSDKFLRTHIFSSFFYRRLTQKPSRRHKDEEDSACTSIQQRRHSRIRTWTRHVDIFEKDFLIVPINESAHWYLAIICYPGLTSPEMAYRPVKDDAVGETPSEPNAKKNTESRTKSKAKNDNADKAGASPDATQSTSGKKSRGKARKAPAAKSNSEQYARKMPCILVFDSLAGPGRNGVIRILREYLQVEWDVKKKEKHGPRHFTKDNMKGATPECPQQSNFSDCGIYVLQYVESFFTDPIEDFTFPLKLVEKWFNEEKVKCKRSGLQQLILDMQVRYNSSLEYNPENDGCFFKRETDDSPDPATAAASTSAISDGTGSQPPV